jgi:uncharacterized protein DUF5661
VTTKSAFNADEWAVITTAPTLTAMYVSAAERGGGLSESLAAARAYAAARAGTGSELLRDILGTPPAIDRSAGKELVEQALTRLRTAIQTLERHSPDDEEVNEYKRFIYSVAEAVAHAHREGGFLGIGGNQVSEREQAALDEIGAIFDQPRTAHLDAPLPRTTFSESEAREAGSAIGIDWDTAPFDADQFRRGMEVELEHGRHDPSTNVTDDDPLTTAKIALAHLKELPDYYDRLAVMEGER